MSGFHHVILMNAVLVGLAIPFMFVILLCG